MQIISPDEKDKFVEKVLDKINSNYEPELVPVVIDESSKIRNCYLNVDEKVKKDGGKVHYGWAIFKSDILCEAERHAVWENEEGDLVDITPREVHFDQIMFVSDNDFNYEGQLVDNIRVNITNNKVIDDFILVCENLEKLYTYGTRINDEEMMLPPQVAPKVGEYESLKVLYLNFIDSGGTPSSRCICGGQKNYKNCHGATLKKNISNDMTSIHNQLNR